MTVSTPPKEKSSASNAVSVYKKSVQFAFNDCYNAFQNIKTKEQLMDESNRNSNVTGKNKDPQPYSVPELSECNQGASKKGPLTQRKSSLKGSRTSNSLNGIRKLSRHSQSRHPKLDELLANLDSSISEDSGCNSKNSTDNHDSVVPSVKQKRPFSGVSERTSKKRSANHSDLFNEIGTMCPLEIPINCLGTAQQCYTETVTVIDCEETEVYNLKDVLKLKTPEAESKQSHSLQNKHKNKELEMKDSIQAMKDPLVTNNGNKSPIRADKMHCKKDGKELKMKDGIQAMKEFKQSHSPQNKHKNKELETKGSIQAIKDPLVNNENKSPIQSDKMHCKKDGKELKMKDSTQVMKDPLVTNNGNKSPIRSDKMHCKKDGKSIITDKSKIKNKNVELDILTVIKAPLKTIQLPPTETCALNEINTHGDKVIDKQKPKKRKKPAEKETKSESNNTGPSSSGKPTQIKDSCNTFGDQNLQPSAILESLPICATNEDDSFASSKNSTSVGNGRPRRRPYVNMKEPSLNKKMRR